MSLARDNANQPWTTIEATDNANYRLCHWLLPIPNKFLALPVAREREGERARGGQQISIAKCHNKRGGKRELDSFVTVAGIEPARACWLKCCLSVSSLHLTCSQHKACGMQHTAAIKAQQQQQQPIPIPIPTYSCLPLPTSSAGIPAGRQTGKDSASLSTCICIICI